MRHGESHQPNTGIDAKTIADINLIFHIDSIFQARFFFNLTRGESIDFHHYCIGTCLMVGDGCAREDAVRGVGVVGDVVLRRVVADARAETGVEGLVIWVAGPFIVLVTHVGVHRIVVEYQREVGKYLVGKQMVPTGSGSGVLPEKPDIIAVELPETVVLFLCKMELVAPEIGAEVELVFLAEVEVELGVEVEKVIAHRGTLG